MYSQQPTPRDDLAHLVHVDVSNITQLIHILDVLSNHADTYIAQRYGPFALLVMRNLFPVVFSRFRRCRFGLFGLRKGVDA